MDKLTANYRIRRNVQQKQAEKIGGHTYSSKAIIEEVREIMEKDKHKERNKANEAMKHVVSEKERLKILDKQIIPILEGEVEIVSVMLRDSKNSKKDFERIEKTLERAKRELARKFEERNAIERKLGRTLDYSR
jgi:uncharacterized protein YpuA (DUF1002 family)